MFYAHPPKRTIPSYINKDGDRIESGDTFIYELSKYRYFKNRVELVAHKFITSEKAINSKSEFKYYPNKKKWEYIEELNLAMLVAPYKYIISNHLPYWELKSRKNERHLSRRRTRRL